jgi:hypothetical protein
MTPKKQVSPAIRILRGERDASARATHLEAATRKFLEATNERKYMSTKTNFKRIALVAVAALGLGLLSSVPAKAVGNLSVTVTNGSFTAAKADSTNAATIAVSATLENTTDTITVSVVANGTLGDSVTSTTTDRIARVIYLDTSTAARTLVGTVDTSVATAETNTANIRNPTNITNSKLDSMTVRAQGVATATQSARSYTISAATVGNVGATFGVQVDSVASTIIAGTYSFTVFVKQYTQGVAVPVTTTYTVSLVAAAAADVSNTATSTYGFAFLKSTTTSIGTGTSTTTDEAISALATTGTTRAYLYVGVRNAANGAATADESLTATVTGSGLVCLQDGSSCGKSLGPISSTAGDYEFELRGDGTGGTSSVKVTGSVTGASYTKSLSYYAAAAKTLTASVLTPVLAIGSNDSAVAVTAVDAAGANWGGTAYIYASAAADATAVGGSATTPVACVFRATNNTHYCPISATTAGTGKFKVIDASTVALATATSNEVTVTSKLAIPASVKISFNKATYAPGEVGLILITPLDAAGAALPASTISNVFTSGGITSDVGLLYNGSAVSGLDDTTATVAATSGTTRVAGSEALVFTAPVSGGKITLTATGGTGLPLAGQVAITASATVTDNGAAALAAVTALATTVASLRTLITTLTNLVLKIQKKVKA